MEWTFPRFSTGRLAASIAKGVVLREDVFLQTKYTFRRGQDHRLPYDPKAAIPEQVEQSFASSLAHLGVERIDSYLLHGPTSSNGLTADDWAAWRAMETIHDSGRARMLGVSNFQIEQLQQLCEKARVRPRFVQNRCYAGLGWDGQVREFCRVHDVVYQGFSLLTANRSILAAKQLARIAARHQRTIPQIIFRFAIQAGMIPLTGTTDPAQMRADLDVFDFHLEPAETAWIAGAGTP